MVSIIVTYSFLLLKMKPSDRTNDKHPFDSFSYGYYTTEAPEYLRLIGAANVTRTISTHFCSASSVKTIIECVGEE